MATNIPTHNAGEVIDAALAMIANPDITLDELMKIIPGPDFPTGGIILGRSGIRQAFETGRGGIPLRARAEIEEIRKDRSAIIVREIPYQVNKNSLIERIAELVRSKQVEGISDLRDESDRDGMRIVIELKRDATPEVVLNHLYRFTQMQTQFSANMLALDVGRPRLMGLKDLLAAFVAFREDVILRRSRFDLGKARERAHLLVGLAIAVANIDEIIRVIRASPDATVARTELMARDWPAGDIGALLALIDDSGNLVVDDTVRLTDAQARGILELRLARLTGLERDKIQAELKEVADKITDLLDIIGSRPRRLEVMVAELGTVRAEIASPRMTAIVDAAADQDDESLIEPGQMVVTITRDGFIKRTGLDAFRQQVRGGRGRSALGMRGDDVVTRSFNAHTHQWVLFFSSGGQAFREKVWRLPEAQPAAKGRALVNLLPDLGGDTITTVLPLPQDEALWDNLHLLFATAKRRRAAQQAVRFRPHPRLRHDRDEAGRGRPPGRRRHLPRGRRRAARHPQRPLHPLRRDRRRGAGLRRAGQRRRARHPVAERRRGDQPVDPAARGGERTRAGRLPARRRGPAPRAGRGCGRVRRGRRRCRGRPHRRSRPGQRRAPGGDGAAGGAAADGDECRVRQALVGLRLPGDRAGRAGDHQHRAGGAQGHRPWSARCRCAPART